MINWFEQYDQETYMVRFDEISYSRFNPISKDTTFFTTSVKQSYNFELALHAFKGYLENHNSSDSELLKRRLHDPLA